MGLFALPMGNTWKENLGNLKANIELLEQYPDADYLFSFMQGCLDKAKNQYFKEKEMKNDRRSKED